jgi:ornithine decarboxylase
MKEKLNKEFIDLRRFENPINPIELIKSITSNPNIENDPFYIVDLEDICNKHINWITRLPRVEPHYAVKCNTDAMLLKLLAFLGAGFDCASKNEIQKVLDLGVAPDRIVFANPCKQASYIKYAYKMSVDTMTFDNELELYKIKENHPHAKCVLRIITNDENAVCRFSMKFGADMETSLKLIETAAKLGLDLAGVSFHVGSGQMQPSAFSESIANARLLFDYAREHYGIRMHLLDLGGGYPGASDSGDLFTAIAKEINRALDIHFPVDYFAQLNGTGDNKLRVIAEPGRYYACSAFTLCVNVIAKRAMASAGPPPASEELLVVNESNGQCFYSGASVDTSQSVMYYINDGVYASFNCLFYDHAECSPILLDEAKCGEDARLFKSSIWGPTCDGLDVVVKESYLPELHTGEFLAFKNMGAYTLSGAVAFNGIPLAKCIYVASTSWETIKAAFNEPMDEPLVCSLLKEATSNSSTCAAAATMAFTRALTTIQQQHSVDGLERASADEILLAVGLNELNIGEERRGEQQDGMASGSEDIQTTPINTGAAVDCAITC